MESEDKDQLIFEAIQQRMLEIASDPEVQPRDLKPVLDYMKMQDVQAPPMHKEPSKDILAQAENVVDLPFVRKASEG